MNLDRQKALYLRAKDFYYYGQPLMEDSAYDALEKAITKADPDWEPLHHVGAYVPADTMLTKVQNTVSTNSLRKMETEADLRKWHESVGGGQLAVELKADGSTCIIYYKDGYFEKAVTRGGDDGVGEDITPNAVKFKGIPKKFDNFTGGVRGEVVLTYEDYKTLDADMSGNVRNIGNGMMRRTDGTGAELLTFLAFNYESTETDESGPESEFMKVQFLKSHGFQTMITHYCETIDKAIEFWHQTAAGRDQLPHKIDGIVFKVDSIEKQKELGSSSGKPKGEVVLKFEAPGAITTILDVIITQGHNGVIKPTATLESVVIDNTNVSSAQLNNWDIIEDMDVAIGDKVRVIKAKDIIPYIEEVVERPANRKPIPRPTACPFCGGVVDRTISTKGKPGVEVECKNQSCPEKVVQKIENWTDKQNILYIGETVLRAMVKMFKMTSPADLYRVCCKDNLATLSSMSIGSGVLGSNADRIVEQVEKTRQMTLKQFLGGLSVRFLGRRRVELIQQALPGQMDTLDDWRSNKLLDLADQASIGTMAGPIVSDIMGHSDLIDDLLKYIEIVAPEQPKPKAGGVLAGKVFVFTGKIERVDAAGVRFTRDRLHQKVLDNGGAVDDKIKKSTESSEYHLVQADPSSTSSKTVDANKKGAKIVSESDFFKMIGE